MKLVIFGDTHLGRKNFKVDEREKDFLNSFTQVIDYSILNQIECVIHSGDLFDTAKPNINIILFVIKELQRLKEKNIKFFVIAGSHDVGINDTFLNVLDSLKLLTNITNKRYYEANENKIELKGEVYKELFICGIPGKNNIIESLKYVNVDIPENKFSIFVFHHIIEDISPLFSSIKKSDLPENFDLYISGHWHGKFITKVNNSPLIYAGSTESCNLSEMKNKEKGFFSFDTNLNKLDFINLKTRNVIINEIDCNEKDSLEILDEIISLIKPGNKDMLFFILKGVMKNGVKSDINKHLIYETAIKNNYLLCRVYFSELLDQLQEQILIEKKSIKEIEAEFFKSKGFNNNQIKTAINLMTLLSDKSNNNEIIEILKKSDLS